MKILLAIFIAVACGVAGGAGMAVLKIRQYPWNGGGGIQSSPGSGRVAVNQEEFNFGKMYFTDSGKHEFVLFNRGDHNLTLSAGSTSCVCTVSEIKDTDLAPGQSTKVLVSWRSMQRAGPFHQSVTILTSDPLRPEVTFTIKGEYIPSIYADPDELIFGQIAGNKPVTRETRIFCNLPNQQIKIQRRQVTDPSLENFFQIDDVPLSADELRKHKGVASGILVRVTVKPGLPAGRFQQRILLSTNLPAAPEVDLPLFGTVGGS